MPGSRSFKATHRNGTALAAAAKVTTRKGRGFRLLLRNLHASDPLLLSFDNGREFYSIEAGGKFEEDVAFHFFWVQRGGANNIDYTAVLLEG